LINGEKPTLIPKKQTLQSKFNPLVSVVIPTYNRAGLLKRAVKSVLNQTYSNFELIIVDDCSTDDTETVAKSFRDSRIRYIRHKKNQGAPAARNNGILASKAQYIAFQDSDDEWLPTKLEKQVNSFSFAPHDLGVVYTSFWLIDQGKKTLIPAPDIKKTEGKIYTELLKKNFVNTPTALVRKECFEKVGMFENIPRLQDWELWLRLSKHYHFKHLNEPLVIAHRQPDSISRNIDAYISAYQYILSKNFDEISKETKLLTKHYFEIGTVLCLKGDIKAGRKYFLKALMAQPFNAKLLLWTIASTFGLTTYNTYAAFYLMLKHTRNLKHQKRNSVTTANSLRKN
jgi:glycosyltransferase involved in cell wall biosynthesis